MQINSGRCIGDRSPLVCCECEMESEILHDVPWLISSIGVFCFERVGVRGVSVGAHGRASITLGH